VLSRVTLIGATYFVVICLIPELLILWWQVPFYLGGISLLVLVCTVLDVEGQVRDFARVRVGGSRQ
jgi:preprotein translocase subunit SecY